MTETTTRDVRDDLEFGLPPEEPRQVAVTPRVVQEPPSPPRGKAVADARFYDFCTMRDGLPDIDKLCDALAEAQKSYDAVKAEYTAKVESRRTGGKFEYDYADLAAFIDALRPKLAAQGIAFFQLPLVTERAVTVKTVFAKGNQMLWNYMTVPNSEPGPQAIGSATTYAKRYGLGALAGIAAEKDDDGNEAAGASQQQRQGPQPAQRRSQQLAASADAADDNTPMQDQGQITECTLRADGVTVIRLDTGLRAFTRDRGLGERLANIFKSTADGRPKTVRITASTEPGVQVPVVARVEEL